MKGKIDTEGELWVTRGGKGTRQVCPWDAAKCSHYCPHFGEPYNDNIRQPERMNIEICHGKVLVFDEFEDER